MGERRCPVELGDFHGLSRRGHGLFLAVGGTAALIEAERFELSIECRAADLQPPRPAGWAERRQRLDEAGSVWPVADDIKLSAVDLDGIPGEWSIAPGSDANRVLMFFHGGGYCSGSIASHRRMVTEAGRYAGARTLAVIAWRLSILFLRRSMMRWWRGAFCAAKASRRHASPLAATAPAAASRRR